jgi:hypothetical protein
MGHIQLLEFEDNFFPLGFEIASYFAPIARLNNAMEVVHLVHLHQIESLDWLN